MMSVREPVDGWSGTNEHTSAGSVVSSGAHHLRAAAASFDVADGSTTDGSAKPTTGRTKSAPTVRSTKEIRTKRGYHSFGSRENFWHRRACRTTTGLCYHREREHALVRNGSGCSSATNAHLAGARNTFVPRRSAPAGRRHVPRGRRVRTAH